MKFKKLFALPLSLFIGFSTASASYVMAENHIDIDNIQFQQTLKSRTICKKSGLTVTSPPEKMVYLKGEKLDLSGIYLNGSYTFNDGYGDITENKEYDGKKYKPSGITIDDSEFNSEKAGVYTIYFNYNWDSNKCGVLTMDENTGEWVKRGTSAGGVSGCDTAMIDVIVKNDENDEYLTGDANCNGIIDAMDASKILTYYVEMSVQKRTAFFPGHIDIIDANKDGSVSAIDASLVLTYYAYTSVGNDISFAEFVESFE